MTGQPVDSVEPLQRAKQVVLDFHRDVDAGLASIDPEAVAMAFKRHTAGPNYRWRGLHPFGEATGSDAVVESFYRPLMSALGRIQRRPDVFLAGTNDANPDDDGVWVCQMGHLVGLFDHPWLDIPPTRKMCFFRYAEFNRVDGSSADGRITDSALFFDVISVMRQAGVYPLPPQTGSSHVYPGPATHDGLLLDAQDPVEGDATMALVNRMIEDLSEANRVAADTGDNRVPADVLRRSWHEDMIWSGPEGIGATYTIERYQEQHQYPFRFGLAAKTFNGHVARFAEGDYACFFGWPNLTNQPSGGFLGLPSSGTAADMRVVDVYRRHGDKLAENWVFIDVAHWLNMQGLDVLQRLRQQQGLEGFS